MRDDDDLLTAWASGERDAAAELIHRYSDDVLRFFRGKLSTDAEDLVQHTFLDCLEQRNERPKVASFRAYLFAIARHRLIDHFRRQQVRGTVIDPQEISLADLGVSALSLIARQDEERLLLEALRQLPVDRQIIIELYYWEKLSGPELASVFTIPEATVRSRIRRAVEQLRVCMARLQASPEAIADSLSTLKNWTRDL